MSTIIAHPRFAPDTQPDSLYPAYRSTVQRSPRKPLIYLPHTLSERTGPIYGHSAVAEGDNDLTRHPGGEPQGQRIIVTGKVMDEAGRPLRNTLIELWQANAGGRYFHHVDNHPAPLDPNFTGAGRALTDDDGNYRFITIKPGCYPWENHPNAWRPAHIHFSLVGPSLVTRLITQMYFPDDPLFPYDPIFQSIRDEKARQRMISSFDLQTTVPNWALGFQFNIVLRGPEATPFEE
jgi:protocatechuate 3,4-dioxygenase beta subunit